MKFVLALTTLAAVASAQQVKACDGKAQACLDTATPAASSCKQGDWYCGCQPDNMSKIQGAATNCVIEACGGAAGALAVITEVQGICEEALKNPPKTDEPAPTSNTPEPTESSKAPEQPTESSKAPEEPEPTASGTASAEPSATGNGTATDKPKPTGENPPQSSFPTAGAGSIAPVAALVLGLFAFAL